METVNEICCDPPLEPKEIDAMHNSFSKKREKETPYYNVFSFFSKKEQTNQDYSKNQNRSKKNQKNDILDPEKITRLQKAEDKKTPQDVMDLVEYLENKDNFPDTKEPFVFPDNAWMGLHLESVMIFYLVETKKIEVYFLEGEQVWLFWNGKIWQETEESFLLQKIYGSVKNIGFGGFESRFHKNTNIFVILRHYRSIKKWPHHFDLIGQTYENGILLYKDQKLDLISHCPEFKHRKMLHFNWDPRATLNPKQICLLGEYSGGDIYKLHLLRFLIFLFLNPGFGNIGYFINGPAGGAKSSLMEVAQALYSNGVSSVNSQILKSNFVKSDLVKNKHIIVINDIQKKFFNDTLATFILEILGRDLVSSDKKYGNAMNFVSHSTLVLVSNLNPWDFEMFNSEGIDQRLVVLTVPGINSQYRIDNVSQIFKDNLPGLANWASGIDLEFVSMNLRANLVNNIIAPTKTEMQDFFLNFFVYQENSFLATSFILSKFHQYYQESNSLSDDEFANIKKQFTSKKISSALNQFSRTLVKDQKIHFKRKSQARGFLNINLKDPKEVMSFQQELKLNQDPLLTTKLQESPFKQHGHVIYNRNNGGQQYLSEHDQ